MVFDRIVCGIDGSRESLEGLRQAIALRAPESRIVALTVCELSLASHAGFQAARAAAQLVEDARVRPFARLTAGEVSLEPTVQVLP